MLSHSRRVIHEVGKIQIWSCYLKFSGKFGRTIVSISKILYSIFSFKIVTFYKEFPVYFFMLCCSNSNSSNAINYIRYSKHTQDRHNILCQSTLYIINDESGALSGKMLLVMIIENNKIDTYFRSG